jgi:hypothetical protein
MEHYKKFGVPNNFEELLPELKTQTKKWETVCYSGTKINNSAKITFYATPKSNPYGNIILNPGLATNTNIDPLMKTLTFWSLTHSYNVITFDTFLGDFYNLPSFELAQRNTYPEFISLLSECIKFIEPYSVQNKSILIGHSAGAAGLIDALNNLTNSGHKTNIGSVMLFAPWLTVKWKDNLTDIVYRHCDSHGMYNPHKILPIVNIFDIEQNKKTRYVTIMPEFLNDMVHSDFQPELMNQWGPNVTIVAGEKDKKVSIEQTEQRFLELQQQTESNRFKFIVVPNVKHSFLNIGSNTPAVIDLIKSQRRRIR